MRTLSIKHHRILMYICRLLVQVEMFEAPPAMLSMWFCTLKLDEENSKYAGLAQENSFGSPQSHSLRWLVKSRSNAVHLQKKSVINTIWLVLSISDWLIIMTGPGGLLLVVPHVVVSVSWAGLQESEKKTKLGCEKYFCRVTYWAPLGDVS